MSPSTCVCVATDAITLTGYEPNLDQCYCSAATSSIATSSDFTISFDVEVSSSTEGTKEFLGYEGKSGMVSTTKSRKVSSGRPRLLVKSSVPVGLDKIRVILSNGRRILLFKKDLVKQKVVKQIPGIMESFVLWPFSSEDIQSNGNLGYVWIGSQFFEDKKIKSVPYGKSLVLHTKALENLSDKMEADLASQVKDEVYEDCLELGEKKIFKIHGGYWQLKIKIADYLMKMYGDYIWDHAKVKEYMLYSVNKYNISYSPLKVYAKSARVEEKISSDDDLNFEKRFHRTKITKLNNENFGVWQIKMQLVLDDLKLWDFKTKKPKINRESWKEIMFAIEDNQFVHVENLTDGAAAWDALSKHHEKNGMIGKINTLRKFFTTQFVSGTLDDHWANLVTTQRKLVRLGVELNNDIVIAVLLNSLPSQYDSLVYAWDAVSETLSLDDVISKLKNLKDITHTEGVNALQVKMDPRSCFKCGKIGHFKKDCPNNFVPNQKQRPGNKGKKGNLKFRPRANKVEEKENYVLQASTSTVVRRNG